MSEVWFSSDFHGFHKNICRGSSSWNDKSGTRDFDNEVIMTEQLVHNINSCVKQDDKMYFLGDWAFGGKENIFKLRSLIVCQNIYLCLGNHDHHIKNDPACRALFGWVKDVEAVRVGNRTFFLSHYAHRIWDKSHHGRIHLYGHSHSTLPDDPHALSMDVGVDCHQEFRPFHYDEVLAHMAKKTPKPVDHHDRETT